MIKPNAADYKLIVINCIGQESRIWKHMRLKWQRAKLCKASGPTSYVTAGICLCLKNMACGNAHNQFSFGSARSCPNWAGEQDSCGYNLSPVCGGNKPHWWVFFHSIRMLWGAKGTAETLLLICHSLGAEHIRAIQRKLFATLEKLLVRRWVISRKKCQKKLSVCVVPSKAHGTACLKTSVQTEELTTKRPRRNWWDTFN